MRKIICMLLCTIITCTSLHTAQATTIKTIPYSTTMTGDKVFNQSVRVGKYFDLESGSLKVYGDLYASDYAEFHGDVEVTGNLVSDYSVIFYGNIKVHGNADFGKYTEISKTISAKNVTFGNYSNVNTAYITNNTIMGDYGEIDNLSTGGYFQAGKYFDLLGSAKVLGDISIGDYADIEGVLYGYKNIQMEYSPNIEGSDKKIKAVGNLSLGKYSDNTARTYVYGGTTLGEYSNENHSNYSGLFGKIDPLLQYNLSDGEISEIKQQVENSIYTAKTVQNKIDSSNNQVNIRKLQQEKYNIYKTLFNYIADYIETESFDTNNFIAIRNTYIGNTSPVYTNTNIEYKAFLPPEIELKLAELIVKLPNNDRNYILQVVINKIDTLIATSKKQEQKQNTIQKINILLGLKVYIELYLQQNDLLGQLGL